MSTAYIYFHTTGDRTCHLFFAERIKVSLIIIFLLIIYPGAYSQDTTGRSIKKGNMGGYMITRLTRSDTTFNAGYSMYAAAWPLVKAYPGRSFQSGLFGTWMHPEHDKPLPVEKLYTDIEGGLGWWRDTEFATTTPKFIMGGVQLNFAGWANGPGAGRGRDWSKSRGKYGVAQLSPWILWPPDGLNLKQGTSGEWFGSGYLPLPLTEPQARTMGKDVPTGNQCWTLFLNTSNFKGPVAFFTPYFWSEASVENPLLSGLFLDTRPSKTNKPFQMETQHIHSYESQDRDGNVYARMAPTQYPVGPDGNSELLHRLMVYKKEALWSAVESWFKGGPPVIRPIDTTHAMMQKFEKGVRSNWRFYGNHIPKEKRAFTNISSFMDASVTDSATLRVRWAGEQIKTTKSKSSSLVTLPEYYQLIKKGQDSIGTWVALSAKDVPRETGLHDVSFDRKEDDRPSLVYTTPSEDTSSWKNPGPVAGPFKVKLGDGSTVTYYWYRFADQPALLNAGLSKQEREEMQRRASLLHKYWTIDRAYLPPPMSGKLASVDPALLVTPPKGFEIGYVPIVTQQGRE
jgi:hypothetical protein